jgi:hypothetical protein
VTAHWVNGSVKKDFARFELMILAQTDQGLKAECPLRLLDPQIAPTVTTQLNTMMQAWNALQNLIFPMTLMPSKTVSVACRIPSHSLTQKSRVTWWRRGMPCLMKQ